MLKKQASKSKRKKQQQQQQPQIIKERKRSVEVVAVVFLIRYFSFTLKSSFKYIKPVTMITGK